MTSLPAAALKSIPMVLFLMLVCLGFLALLAIPGLGTAMGSSVCEAGELRVSVETPYSRPGESGVVVDYYCEDESGERRGIGLVDLLLAALKYYVAFFVLIVWPLVTVVRYRSVASEERMRREGIPATARIVSAKTTGWRINETPLVRLELEVEVQGKPAFTNKLFKRVHQMETMAFQPGRSFNALVDPQNLQKVLILWDETAPATMNVNMQTLTMGDLPPEFADMVKKAVGAAGVGMPAGGMPGRGNDFGESTDELEALRALKTMRDEGLIDEAEYEAKKAEIMERL